MPSFASEVENAVERLGLERGDSVLDVACGQGNFTLAFAERVGPDGLVVGLDIARAMLARAARHVRETGVRNVLLVRGDALALPIASGAFSRVACSGGLHQIPDLPRALADGSPALVGVWSPAASRPYPAAPAPHAGSCAALQTCTPSTSAG